MKYCSNCGNEVNENAVVCVKCGCSLNAELANKKSKFKSSYILSYISVFLVVEAVAYMILAAVEDWEYGLSGFLSAVVVVGLESIHMITFIRNKPEKSEKNISLIILIIGVIVSIISLCIYVG